MKEIKSYVAEKYTGKDSSILNEEDYKEVEQGIYEHQHDGEALYVTSLSFVQEPEFDEEEYADNISQYPLEDLLDKFYCYISDFYDELNLSNSKTCYLEFASNDIEDIKKLRSIIGRHVYNKAYEEDGNTYMKLVIE